MKVLLTSCGLETERIKDTFENMLTKVQAEVRALFIPTAANSPDAIEVLPKCLNDLLKCGIRRENISVYDLHDRFEGNIEDAYDVVYLCGGDPDYLMKRVNEHGFNLKLLDYVTHDGIVVGVSAGSMIFADDMPNNLGILKCALDVHCSDEIREKAGHYKRNRKEKIRLGNTQAILCQDDTIAVIE